MRDLPLGQRNVLNFVIGFIDRNGYSPSIAEIVAGTGKKALRSATLHLDALQRKGYLKRSKTPRSIVVLKNAHGEPLRDKAVPGRVLSVDWSQGKTVLLIELDQEGLRADPMQSVEVKILEGASGL